MSFKHQQVPEVLVVLCLQVYMELEQGKNVDFWRDMTIITEDEIAKLRKLEASGKGGPGKHEQVLKSVCVTGKMWHRLCCTPAGLQGFAHCSGLGGGCGCDGCLVQPSSAQGG